MRHLFKLIAVVFLGVVIFSGAGLTREQTNIWLNSKNGESSINMSGKWDSGGIMTGGWGEGTFIQEGKYFHGSLGLYYVDGVVVGADVYMAISSGKKVYYTAQLKKLADGTLTGKAVAGIIDKPESNNAESYLISLKKAEDKH